MAQIRERDVEEPAGAIRIGREVPQDVAEGQALMAPQGVGSGPDLPGEVVQGLAGALGDP